MICLEDVFAHVADMIGVPAICFLGEVNMKLVSWVQWCQVQAISWCIGNYCLI
jgi:hypothetical protein